MFMGREKEEQGKLYVYALNQVTVTLVEIQESEKVYIESLLEHPFKTDWKYFWKIVFNILFKGKRSK